MTPEKLEQRLIDFAVSITSLTSETNNSYVGIHLSNQLARSGTSPALNYAEARGA